MIEITLNALELSTKEAVHDYLMEAFEFPDYYGKNLDALYDCLTELGPEDYAVYFTNMSAENPYMETVYQVFMEASETNSHLTIINVWDFDELDEDIDETLDHTSII